MRIAATIIFFLSLTVGLARNQWFDPAAPLAQGMTPIDVYYEPVEDATIHIRAAFDSKSEVKWGLVWDYVDDCNHKRAILTLPQINHHDMLMHAPAVIEVINVADGVESTVSTEVVDKDIDLDGGFNSLRLDYASGSAALYVGASDPAVTMAVPFDGVSGQIFVYASAPGRCKRLQSVMHGRHQPPHSQFVNVDALMAHIRQSDDIAEGVWEFMDRSMDCQKAALGGHYRLATVSGPEGYDIVYISGADVYGNDWSPLMLKGRLKPTIFKGNYDLIWYDALGHELDGEMSAQVSEDNAILTLSYPLLNTTIRLRRIP